MTNYKNKIETESNSTQHTVPIIKSANTELKQVMFIAMLPDSVDLHGDYTSADEVRKAKESFNKSPMNANLYHSEMTDSFYVLESYLMPVDVVIGTEFVTKGTWVQLLQITNDGLWQMIEDGEVNGISIGATATVEEV